MEGETHVGHAEELLVPEVNVVSRDLGQQTEVAIDRQLAGGSQGQSDGSLRPVAAGGGHRTVQAVASKSQIKPRLPDALASSVLAAHGEIVEVGVAQRAKEFVLIQGQLSSPRDQVGVGLGDHSQVELEALIGVAGPGIGVEGAADAAEKAHCVGIQLLSASGGRKQEKASNQQEPAEQAVVSRQDPSFAAVAVSM